MSKVRYISTNTIQLSKNHHTRIDLTPWDLQLLFIPPIQYGLFYRKPKSSSYANIVDHLKVSLSRTLEFYPLLVGRLGLIGDGDTSSFFIDCNNAGALFAHAIANVSIGDMLEPIYVPSILRSFFLLNGIYNHEAISQPLLAVQVTELVDGFFIGCTMNHAISDGVASVQFLESWSEISKTDHLSQIPVFRRWFPSDMNFPIRLPIMSSSKLEDKFVYPPLEERVFHFPNEKIVALKARANKEMSTTNITSLQAILAHTWLGIVRCRGTKVDKEVKCILAIDTRRRLRPALPENYFGSAVTCGVIDTTAGELLSRGLGWVAMEMNKVVGAQTDTAVRSFLKDWLENPKLISLQSDELVINSSPHFDLFKIDFGWGKPVAMRSGSAHKTDGSFMIYRGLEEGSVDISVCLLPDNLHALGNDEEFMEAVGPLSGYGGIRFRSKLKSLL